MVIKQGAGADYFFISAEPEKLPKTPKKEGDFSLKTTPPAPPPPAHIQILQTWRDRQYMSLSFMKLRRNPSLQNA